ncbi:hypothetical protein ABEY43_06745 [Priestia megaterium]
MIKIGDWVNVKGSIGYIVYKNYTETSIKLKFSDGQSDVYSKHDISPSPINLTNRDIYDLQHIAVNTGDKKWFMELSNMLREE